MSQLIDETEHLLASHGCEDCASASCEVIANCLALRELSLVVLA